VTISEFDIFVWLHIDALLGGPVSRGVHVCGADNLHLTGNWSAVGVARDGEVVLRVHVLEAHLGVDLPIGATAQNRPVVARVTFPSLPEGAHLLIARQWTRKVMRMKVLVGRQVGEANVGATGHGLAALAQFLRLGPHLPIAVDVFLLLGARHRLLSTAGAIFDVVRM